MGHREHKEKASGPVDCAVITCSDSREPATDTSGAMMVQMLEAAGHRVVGRAIVVDEPDRIVAEVRRFAIRPDVQAILVNGGTGLSRRDSTFEAVEGLLEKRITGFGELFRMLSYQEIGSSAMLSRATAGLVAATALFSVPGSPAAVRLAMERLIVPELAHVVWLVGKPGPPGSPRRPAPRLGARGTRRGGTRVSGH